MKGIARLTGFGSDRTLKEEEATMEETPSSSYVDVRDGGYYVAGTRIGLDIIFHEFQSGKSPEAILQSHFSIGSLVKV